MVGEQGQVIDNIDANVENATVNVQAGRGFLQTVKCCLIFLIFYYTYVQARKHFRSRRNKILIIIVLAVILGMSNFAFCETPFTLILFIRFFSRYPCCWIFCIKNELIQIFITWMKCTCSKFCLNNVL